MNTLSGINTRFQLCDGSDVLLIWDKHGDQHQNHFLTNLYNYGQKRLNNCYSYLMQYLNNHISHYVAS